MRMKLKTIFMMTEEGICKAFSKVAELFNPNHEPLLLDRTVCLQKMPIYLTVYFKSKASIFNSFEINKLIFVNKIQDF